MTVKFLSEREFCLISQCEFPLQRDFVTRPPFQIRHVVDEQNKKQKTRDELRAKRDAKRDRVISVSDSIRHWNTLDAESSSAS